MGRGAKKLAGEETPQNTEAEQGPVALKLPQPRRLWHTAGGPGP